FARKCGGRARSADRHKGSGRKSCDQHNTDTRHRSSSGAGNSICSERRHIQEWPTRLIECLLTPYEPLGTRTADSAVRHQGGRTRASLKDPSETCQVPAEPCNSVPPCVLRRGTERPRSVQMKP